MLFTPEPLYVKTGATAVERHSAHNTAQSCIKKIEALGKKNVSAFVSGTEPRMRPLWTMPEVPYP